MAGKTVTYILNLKSNITEGLNKASNSVKGFESKLSSVGAKTQSVFGGMLKFNILENIASGALNLGKSMITMASDVENSKVAFEVLLGSAEKAKNMLGDMKKFADKTPFTFTDLQAAGKTMLGFQIPADKVMTTLKNLGDVSMGDSEKLKSMTLAFSQMSAAGKLQGQDLNQMINAGFNPLGEMARTSGKSVGYFKDQMAKGAISADMVAKAFETATAKGGPFFGMMERMSKTTAGRWSTLKDQIQTIGISIGTAILPTLNKLMDYISEFFSKINVIKSILQPIFDIIVNLFNTITSSFSNFDFSIDGLIKGFQKLVQFLTPFYEGVADAIGFLITTIMQILTPLYPIFETLMKLMYGIFQYIKILVKELKVALQPVIFTLTILAKVIGIIFTIISELISIIGKLINKFKEITIIRKIFDGITLAVKFMGEKIKWIYDNILQPVLDKIIWISDKIQKLLGIDTTRPEAVKNFSEDQIREAAKDKTSKNAIEIQKVSDWAMKNRGAKGSTEIINKLAELGWYENWNKFKEGQSKNTVSTSLKTATSPSTVKSNSPNNINISIGNLIEEFTVATTTLKEGSYQIKEIVSKVLLEAINDVNLVR